MSDLDNDIDLDAEPTEEEILLVTAYPGPRIFTLNNSKENTVLGVLMDETDDSFLVGLPCRLIESGSTAEQTVLPLVPAPYIRLLKSSVVMVMFLFEPYKTKYLRYIEEFGPDVYPQIVEYIDEGMPSANNKSKVIIELVEETEDDIREAAGEAARQLSVNTGSGTEQKAQGMSDEELQEYLMNKYKNGDLYGGPGSKQ